jgi:alginate O-acetyltransferase complex protein AlgI
VYGDFSGYSDIARGVSKLFGVELIVNFNFPFFSKSIPEFWSRWHISLSLWLNDYVFTPLALNFRHYGKHGLFLAVFITFLLAGLWHGAAWHFVFYGAYFGILYLPSIYGKKGIKSLVKKKAEDISFIDIPRILFTFTLVCFGFLLFRMNSLNDAFGYIMQIIRGDSLQLKFGRVFYEILVPLFFIIILIILDWKNRLNERDINVLKTKNTFWIHVILLLIVLIHLFKGESNIGFIYFQF